MRIWLRIAISSLIFSSLTLAGVAHAAADPSRMQQYRLEKNDTGYRLALRETTVPAPAAHEVLVRVRAASLNRRDLLVRSGQYGGGADMNGIIPLSDGAGEVTAIGTGVTRFKPGDRVAATFFQGWISGKADAHTAATALGGAVDGMLSEYVVLNEDGLVRFPEFLSFEEAATLPCAAVTAWNGLFTRGNLQLDEIVLLEGTGGVSIFGLQFALAAGAKAIITSSSDAKLERAKQLGAWQTVNYRTTPDWDKTVMQLTGGHGVDQILEVGGESTLPKVLAILAIDAHVAYIGGLSGWGAQIPAAVLPFRNAQVSGIYVGSRADFEAMNAFLARHRLKPVIDRVFDFADAAAAYQYMESGNHFGKIVIRLP
ncbi:MAG TPA: NAD(P)-dependent alcohol dehydrogenase [Steroidobacteraceae bacterium]|nr:NAD(P)-dependent alcohol dehydrogenase [Steroidobacteraceae bacterium]